MTRHSVVLTTVGSEEEASKLAKSLVDSHLAACVSIIPNVRSVYNWKDKLHEDKECMLVIKTATAMTDKLQAHFAAHHSYEVPEFLVLKIDEESPPYLRWMEAWLDPRKSNHKSRKSKVAGQKESRRSKVEDSRRSQVESHKSKAERTRVP